MCGFRLTVHRADSTDLSLDSKSTYAQSNTIKMYPHMLNMGYTYGNSTMETIQTAKIGKYMNKNIIFNAHRDKENR
jgi:hypothetical protein